MRNNLTVTSFFKKYREQIPYSLSIFRRAIINNLDKLQLNGVVLVLESKSRNTYKILDVDKLLELLKKGELK